MGTTVLVSPPEAIRTSNDKAEAYALLQRIGVRAPAWRKVTGSRALSEAAQELGYPTRPVCFKPVFSSGSRGFRVLDPTVDRAKQLLEERPGNLAMRLTDVLELLPEEGGPDLLVMELAQGKERGGPVGGARVEVDDPEAPCNGPRYRALPAPRGSVYGYENASHRPRKYSRKPRRFTARIPTPRSSQERSLSRTQGPQS